MTPETAATPSFTKQQTSLWALASLLCAIAFICPIAPILSLVFALVGALDLRRHPHRRGKRLVAAGVIVSVLALCGWGVAARLWEVHARRPMLYGPVEAIAAGQNGDVAGFRDAFLDQASEPEAAAFLDSVNERYGWLAGSSQRDDGAQPVSTVRRARIPYTFLFETGPVEAEAEFIIAAEHGGFVLRFAWVVIHDPVMGDLVYPATEAPP